MKSSVDFVPFHQYIFLLSDLFPVFPIYIYIYIYIYISVSSSNAFYMNLFLSQDEEASSKFCKKKNYIFLNSSIPVVYIMSFYYFLWVISVISIYRPCIFYHTHTHIHTRACARTRVCVRTCSCVRACVRACVNTHTNTHIYIYIYNYSLNFQAI